MRIRREGCGRRTIGVGPMAVAILALLGLPAAARAQSSANITAQATVVSGVTVTPQANLDFGNVFQGLQKSVAITDATAGLWQITGNAGSEVSLSFTLPTDLSDGTNLLPIGFAATDAGHNVANLPGTATTFDPSSGTTADIGLLPAELYVWIVGTVSPGASQVAGVYTGTVTLTVQYTGN